MMYNEYDHNKIYQLNDIIKFGNNTYKCIDKDKQYFEPLQKPKRPPNVKGPDIVVYEDDLEDTKNLSIPVWLSIILVIVAFLLGKMM